MWKFKSFMLRVTEDLLDLFRVLLFIAILLAPSVVVPFYLVDNDFAPLFVISITLGVSVIWAIVCLNFYDTFLS